MAKRTRGDVWVAGALVLLRGCWALFFFPEASGLLSALFFEWPAQGQAEDVELRMLSSTPYPPPFCLLVSMSQLCQLW